MSLELLKLPRRLVTTAGNGLWSQRPGELPVEVAVPPKRLVSSLFYIFIGSRMRKTSTFRKLLPPERPPRPLVTPEISTEIGRNQIQGQRLVELGLPTFYFRFRHPAHQRFLAVWPLRKRRKRPRRNKLFPCGKVWRSSLLSAKPPASLLPRSRKKRRNAATPTLQKTPPASWIAPSLLKGTRHRLTS